MAFVTKTWKDRLVEYAGRRKLKNVATGEEILMDVSRSEGTVNQAGDAFSAANMNNLEQRIKTEFDSVYSSLKNENNESFNFGVKDGVRGFYTDPARADDSFVPFKSDSGITYTKFNNRKSTITIKIQKNGDGIISTSTGTSCSNISINGEAIQADNLESFQADASYSGLSSMIFVLHNLKKGDVLTFYNGNQYGGFFIM